MDRIDAEAKGWHHHHSDLLLAVPCSTCRKKVRIPSIEWVLHRDDPVRCADCAHAAGLLTALEEEGRYHYAPRSSFCWVRRREAT